MAAPPCHRHLLDNGLRVVIAPDPETPTCAVAVYYDVGSRDEPPGKTGFAHLFEHMMFEGSANVGKFGHIQAIQRVGGSVNGTTSADRTNYFQSAAPRHLELMLWLEADRMRSLRITAENFENQRETVKEERRQSYDNRPYAKAYLRANELAYASFAYAHSTIGSMDDLDAAPLAAVQAFFDTYYLPNNAVLSIAGDVDADEALALARRHFADIPRRADPPRPVIDEPPQRAEKAETVRDRLARLPALLWNWHIPPARTPDSYPLELAATILGDGKASRLVRRLVDERELAVSVDVGRDGRRGPDLFSITLMVQAGVAPDAARAAVHEEIARLAADGPDAAELARARTRVRARHLFGLQTSLARALRLAEYELYWGDARQLADEPARYDAVTAADVTRVARAYLTAENRTVVEVLPDGG